MRCLRRLDVVPPTLALTGAGGKTAAAHVQYWQHGQPDQITFPSSKSHWLATDVKGALYAQHWRICAYCSQELGRGDWGDVEHFRPKGAVYEDRAHGGYWWLVYEFSNYLLSCGYCNSARKRTKFPLLPRRQRVRFDNQWRIPYEARVLVDPTLDDELEDWFVIEFVESDREDDALFCFIKAREDLDRHTKKRVDDVIEFFALNEPSLVAKRNEVAEVVMDKIVAGKQAESRVLASRFHPHSLVAKQVLEEDGLALPNESDEFDGLIEDILTELEISRMSREYHGTRDPTTTEKELFWALAALWHAPPHGDHASVEAALEAGGVLDDVQPLREQFITLESA